MRCAVVRLQFQGPKNEREYRDIHCVDHMVALDLLSDFSITLLTPFAQGGNIQPDPAVTAPGSPDKAHVDGSALYITRHRRPKGPMHGCTLNIIVAMIFADAH